jgi:putative tricarboxylic transport membrane protein
LLEIPKPQLYGGIMLFAVLGVYSLHQSAVDVLIMIVVGLMGFVMQRFDFPVTPAIVGLILGPMAEQQFRRAMAISQGDISTFMTRPISGVIMWIVIAILVLPPIVSWYKARKAA